MYYFLLLTYRPQILFVILLSDSRYVFWLNLLLLSILFIQVDDLLDELCQYTKEDDQTQCLTKIAKR